ncbi:hypothetical protein ADIWIN_2765 [Winogradskyella psychrotolerans RS-3]|uniref:Uncharacterized protein n=1 Tax=Winogradskyella psychrotolerans RS-3 TaxID=641526 RepID=S7VPU5_9FLAO|nr:hypothetical protein ADIWIN_2765 [Winogradskyella psychrotolerans RS-3]
MIGSLFFAQNNFAYLHTIVFVFIFNRFSDKRQIDTSNQTLKSNTLNKPIEN